ncbi:MAG: SRPBCC domain-containing protein [Chloroflexota bacterium]|nr:SRPBCC domain-containing protein [Chloroflexota bacterium]
MDDVFRALADSQRRTLLDALRARDGQTLTELERALPRLSRFGVMNHLRVLESGGLVTTNKVGRHKFHYLNPVPIQLIRDRWISRYDAPLVETMTSIKTRLEGGQMQRIRHVYEIYIDATLEAVWRAITDADVTRRYWYGALNRSSWEVGARWTSESPSGELYLEGEILEIDRPFRLVHSFHVVHRAEPAADPPSKVTWELTRLGPTCRLRLIHEDMAEATARYTADGGWSFLLSGMKTLLETGRSMALATAQASET